MDEMEALFLIRRRRKRRRKEMILENRRRMQDMRYASAPFMIDEDTFMSTYHLSKRLVMDLVEELKPHLPAAIRSTSVAPDLKVLCALHFFSQGSYQKSAGRDSQIGLSQSSVSRFLDEVTEALNNPDILCKWIYFPRTSEEKEEVIQKNYRDYGIPGVIGFMAGMQVSIRAPKIDDHLYINQNGYHSVNSQIICDSDLKILNCVARFPGSTEDCDVWSQSAAYKEMMRVWESGEHCWILGHSGYPHQPWLQTPIPTAKEGSPEANYAVLHYKAMCAVERCIGVLKNRFLCLSHSRPLEYSPVKAGKIINACCVLHNMCIQGGIPLPEDISLDEEPFPVVQNHIDAGDVDGLLKEAQHVRKDIINCISC